jgi:hypothetical protein
MDISPKLRKMAQSSEIAMAQEEKTLENVDANTINLYTVLLSPHNKKEKGFLGFNFEVPSKRTTWGGRSRFISNRYPVLTLSAAKLLTIFTPRFTSVVRRRHMQDQQTRKPSFKVASNSTVLDSKAHL